MKLSEAIMLGSVGSPQAFGHTHAVDGSRCAHGAALLAAGEPNALYIRNMYIWPWTTSVIAACPVCGSRVMVFSVIRDLNDSHRWTRAQIAEWVATVEPKEESVTSSADTNRPASDETSSTIQGTANPSSGSADSLYSVEEHAFEHSAHVMGYENARN